MSALLGSGRRADRFDALVEAQRTDGTVRADSLASVGADGRARTLEAELLELVAALRTASVHAPAPSASFSADLRERLMAEADTALIPTDPRLQLRTQTVRRPARGVAAAAVAVILTGTAGMALASRGTTNDDALYQIKRGVEAIGTTFSLSDDARGRSYLDQAGTRLDEVETLLDDDASPEQVKSTLDSFTSATADGSALLLRDYRRNSDPATVAEVRDFAQESMRQLSSILADAPADVRSDLVAAAGVVRGVDQDAVDLCAACGDDGVVKVPDGLQSPSTRDTLGGLMGTGVSAGSLTGTSSAGGGLFGSLTPSIVLIPEIPVISLPALPVLGGDGSGSGSGSGTDTGSGGSAGGDQGGDSSGSGNGSGVEAPGTGGSLIPQIPDLPPLVQLPDSQSGGPSVIDLDSVIDLPTDDTTPTTDSSDDGDGDTAPASDQADGAGLSAGLQVDTGVRTLVESVAEAADHPLLEAASQALAVTPTGQSTIDGVQAEEPEEGQSAAAPSESAQAEAAQTEAAQTEDESDAAHTRADKKAASRADSDSDSDAVTGLVDTVDSLVDGS